MLCDPPPLSSPSRSGVEMSVFKRTYSMPVESSAARASTSASSPSRATFPFKPACTLVALQKSQAETNLALHRMNSHDECQIPATFRPRPVVPALTLHPRRCASFPIDPHSENRTPSPPPPLEPPDWVVSDLREKPPPLFPISIDLPMDSGCWWLDEMTSIVERSMLRPAIVQVGEDEIELVDSKEESSGKEIDIIEEIQIENSSEVEKEAGCIVKESSQTKDAKENFATTNTVTPTPTAIATPFPSQKHQNQKISLDVGTTLEEKMKMLRVEMEEAKDLDPDKRLEMEKLLQQVEGAIKLDERTAEISSAAADENNKAQSALDNIRRTTVAITGGTLTAAGIILIPCPIIPGCLVVYGGLAVLATEFESAKKALDTVREPIEKWLADDEEDKSNADDDEKHNSIMWEEMIGYTPDDCTNDLDEDFMTIMDMKANNDINAKGDKKSADNPGKAQNNPLKPFLRKLLMLDSAAECDPTKINNASNRGTPVSEDKGNHTKIGQSEEPSSANPHSPSCHGELSGCKLLSFDFGDNDDSDDEFPKLFCSDHATDENTLSRQQSIAKMTRLISDGSITLNTLNNDGDESSNVRLFSRQDTVASLSSAYGNDDDCLWANFACNALLEEGCRPESLEGCHPDDSLAIEKKV